MYSLQKELPVKEARSGVGYGFKGQSGNYLEYLPRE